MMIPYVLPMGSQLSLELRVKLLGGGSCETSYEFSKRLYKLPSCITDKFEFYRNPEELCVCAAGCSNKGHNTSQDHRIVVSLDSGRTPIVCVDQESLTPSSTSFLSGSVQLASSTKESYLGKDLSAQNHLNEFCVWNVALGLPGSIASYDSVFNTFQGSDAYFSE